MKTFVLPLLFTLIFSLGINAQEKKGREQIKAFKVAFLSERLSLSTDEAAKFWPIYNAYEEKYLKLKYEDLRKIRREFRNDQVTEIPEKRAQELLSQYENIEDKMFAERKQLNKDLRKVISAKKIILLKDAEEDFYRELIKRLRRPHDDNNK